MKGEFEANAIEFLIERKFPEHNLLKVRVTLSADHPDFLSQTQKEEMQREIDAYKASLLSQ